MPKQTLTVKSIAKIVIPLLKKNNIKKASLFGSHVRGDATKKSDVDIIIQPPKNLGLKFVSLKLELEEKLHRKVDILTYKSIHPYLKKSILSNEVRIL